MKKTILITFFAFAIIFNAVFSLAAYEDFTFGLDREHTILVGSIVNPEIAESLQYSVNLRATPENLSQEALQFIQGLGADTSQKDALFQKILLKIKGQDVNAPTFIINSIAYLQGINSIIDPLPLTTQNLVFISNETRQINCIAKQHDISKILDLEIGHIVIEQANVEITVLNDTIELVATNNTNARIGGFTLKNIERRADIKYRVNELESDTLGRLELRYGSADILLPGLNIKDVRRGDFNLVQNKGEKGWQLDSFDIITGTEQTLNLPTEKSSIEAITKIAPTSSLTYYKNVYHAEGKNIILDKNKFLEDFSAEFNGQGKILQINLQPNAKYIDVHGLFSLSSPREFAIFFYPENLAFNQNALYMNESGDITAIGISADLDFERGKNLTFIKTGNFTSLEIPKNGTFTPSPKIILLTYKPNEFETRSLIINKDGAILQTTSEQNETKKKVPVLTPAETKAKLNELASKSKTSTERVKELKGKRDDQYKAIAILEDLIEKKKEGLGADWAADPEIVNWQDSIRQRWRQVADLDAQISGIILENDKNYQEIITSLQALEKAADRAGDTETKKIALGSIKLAQKNSKLSRLDLLVSAGKSDEVDREAAKMKNEYPELADQAHYYEGLASMQRGNTNYANMLFRSIKDPGLAESTKMTSTSVLLSNLDGLAAQYEQQLKAKNIEFLSYDDLIWYDHLNVFEWPAKFGGKSYSQLKQEVKQNEISNALMTLDGIDMIRRFINNGKSLDEIQAFGPADFIAGGYTQENAVRAQIALQYALDNPDVKMATRQYEGTLTNDELFNLYIEKAKRANAELAGSSSAMAYISAASLINEQKAAAAANALGISNWRAFQDKYGDAGITFAGDPMILATAGLSAAGIACDLIPALGRTAGEVTETARNTQLIDQLSQKIPDVQLKLPAPVSKAANGVSNVWGNTFGKTIYPSTYYQQGKIIAVTKNLAGDNYEGAVFAGDNVIPIMRVSSTDLGEIGEIYGVGKGYVTDFIPITNPEYAAKYEQGALGIINSPAYQAIGTNNVPTLFVTTPSDITQSMLVGPETRSLAVQGIPTQELSASQLASAFTTTRSTIPAGISATEFNNYQTLNAIATTNPALANLPNLAEGAPVAVLQTLATTDALAATSSLNVIPNIEVAYFNPVTKELVPAEELGETATPVVYDNDKVTAAQLAEATPAHLASLEVTNPSAVKIIGAIAEEPVDITIMESELSTLSRGLEKPEPIAETKFEPNKFYRKEEVKKIFKKDPMLIQGSVAGGASGDATEILDSNNNAWIRKAWGEKKGAIATKNEIFTRNMIKVLKEEGFLKTLSAPEALAYYDSSAYEREWILLNKKIQGTYISPFMDFSESFTMEERVDLAILEETLGVKDMHHKNLVRDAEGKLFVFDFEYAGSISGPSQTGISYISGTSYTSPESFKPAINAIKEKEQKILDAVDEAAKASGMMPTDAEAIKLKNTIRTNIENLDKNIIATLDQVNVGLTPETPLQSLEKDVLENGATPENIAKLKGLFPDYGFLQGPKSKDAGIILNRFKDLKQNPIYLQLELDNFVSLYAYTGWESWLVNPPLIEGSSALSPLELSRINELNAALDVLPSYEGTVIRSVSYSPNFPRLYTNQQEMVNYFSNRYKPGTIVKEKAFVSASKNLLEEKPEVIVKIESKTGKDISSMSANPEEKEVLFKSNTNFKVLDVSTDPSGIPVIHMEEVAGAVPAPIIEAVPGEFGSQYGIYVSKIKQQLAEEDILLVPGVKVTDPEFFLLAEKPKEHFFDLYRFKKTGELPDYVTKLWGKELLDAMPLEGKLNLWKSAAEIQGKVPGGIAYSNYYEMPAYQKFDNLQGDLMEVPISDVEQAEERIKDLAAVKQALLPRADRYRRILLTLNDPENDVNAFDGIFHEIIHSKDAEAELRGLAGIKTLRDIRRIDYGNIAYEILTETRSIQFIPSSLIDKMTTPGYMSPDFAKYINSYRKYGDPNSNIQSILSRLEGDIKADPALRKRLLTETSFKEVPGTDEEKINTFLELIDKFKYVNPTVPGYIYVSPETEAAIKGLDAATIQTKFKEAGIPESEIQDVLASPDAWVPTMLKYGLDPEVYVLGTKGVIRPKSN